MKSLEKTLSKEIMDQLDVLPSLPASMMQMLRIVDDDESRVADLVAAMEADPVICTKMLKLANSAFYGGRERISRIADAIVRLGFKVIRKLVLLSHVLMVFQDPHRGQLGFLGFWRHSILTACTARSLGKLVALPDAESFFVYGLLHDIGKIILCDYCGGDYKQVMELCRDEDLSPHEAEERCLGVHHGQVGQWLFEKWSFPAEFASCSLYHHEPQEAMSANVPEAKAIAVIHLSDAGAHRLLTDEHCDPSADDLSTLIDVPPSDMREIAQEVLPEAQAIARSVELVIPDWQCEALV